VNHLLGAHQLSALADPGTGVFLAGNREVGLRLRSVSDREGYPIDLISGGSAASGPDYESTWSSLRLALGELLALGTFVVSTDETLDHGHVPFRHRTSLDMSVELKGRADVLPFPNVDE